MSFLCGCDASSTASGPTSSSTSTSSSQKNEVALSGETGHAEVAGDKIELKNGAVFVNGASFGSVPQGATVKYIVTSTNRELYVAGELRESFK